MVPELSAKVSFINAIVIALTVFFYAFLLESTTFSIHVEGNFSWLPYACVEGGHLITLLTPPLSFRGTEAKKMVVFKRLNGKCLLKICPRKRKKILNKNKFLKQKNPYFNSLSLPGYP